MSTLGFRSHALTISTPSPYTASDTDEAPEELEIEGPGLLTRQPSRDVGHRQHDLPKLTHRLKHDSSILSLALSENFVYAGTQGGQILVYCLSTYQRTAVIECHKASVLGLCLSQDKQLLFSSAGDRIVNVWRTADLTRVCCLYSTYDVGDVFCVSYVASLQTVYLGAQNTSIQWCSLKPALADNSQSSSSNPYLYGDPFFDSKGPGGVRTPKPPGSDTVPRDARGGQVLAIGKEDIKPFAHYGYIYCMLTARGGVPEAAGQEVLISASGDGVIKLWKLNSQKGGEIEEMYALDDERDEGHSVLTIALDGTFLYSGRRGGEIDVWDLETRQLVRNIKAHRDDVLTICVGGGFMFSGAVTGYVRKFDRQHQLQTRLKAHDGRVLASGFTYHKQRPIYVTGGNDDTIAVWDISDCTARPPTGSKTTNEQMFEYLRRFVSFRTVSSDPRYLVDCRRGASFLRSVFKNFGAVTEMLTTTNGLPVIMARFRGNPATAGKRKKILFYGHYDVVAAENKEGKWLTDPFEMEGIDGYLYGRGTSDNKGPIMAALFACAELVTEQALGSDIVFLIEGEEESGSRGFEQAVKANKDKIGDVDWILLSNSYWLDDRIPCLTYGLRGVIHATVQIESGHPDLHSGVDGSAQLDESLKDLIMLLGTLIGKNGEIKIPGFYHPIPDITEEEEELYVDIANALVQRNPDLGDAKSLRTSLMRRWREASLTIHRFNTSGPHNSTVIPRLARASLSIRLVPNQEASEVAASLQSYLKSEFAGLQSNNQLVITIDHQAEPWLGDWTNEIFQTLEEAIMEAWGPIDHSRRRQSSGPSSKSSMHRPTSNGYFAPKPAPTTSSVLAQGSAMTPRPETPVDTAVEQSISAAKPALESATQRRKPLYIREGGSIPAIRFLEKEFDAPAAHFPCGQASDSAHLDNERLRLINLYKSKDIFKKVFKDLPQK
ncbi:glutathione degradosome [Polychaeton citri CBS 116435]|uniref:Glutathione degradosome n=1 Tax=Polychaeton citri CBS 116435 TaxID=1314669 RepID=A0A9P4Q0P1_9PEZI|nr:glutathione degradosome [Polychaeton citri CBS 116435]